MKRRTALVTGGAGFIGSHLVEMLVENGEKVTVIDRLEQRSLINPNKSLSKIEYINSNVISSEVKELVTKNKYNIIFHLANNAHVPSSIENPTNDLENNLLSTFSLLETIRTKSPETNLVYLSSAAVYGNSSEYPIKESAPLAPISPYGVSKLAAERYISLYSQLYGLNTVAIRPFSIYGPRQTKLLIYELMKKLHSNPKELQLLGDGSQVRDFCYVDDAVRAILLVALNSNFKGEVYNLGSAEECSISALSKLVSDVMEVNPRISFSGLNRAGDPQKWVADITKLRNLGYQPMISLRTGIVITYKWFLETLNS